MSVSTIWCLLMNLVLQLLSRGRAKRVFATLVPVWLHDSLPDSSGFETLPLRMQKHVANAMEVAAYLEQHAMVESVSYPGLPSHPDYELAQKMLPKGCGAVFSFEIKGDERPGAPLSKA